MPDWGIVVIIALVLFLLVGAKKLPEMARSIGRAQGEFKKGLHESNDEAAPASPPPQASTPPPSDAPPSDTAGGTGSPG